MVEKLKMIWQDAKQLKDERGLTLVELLVVVVILGIIAAIAVVAIGGIIENSKKDAMVADAKQMVSAAKLYTASNPKAGTLTFLSTSKDADDKEVTSKGDGANYLSNLKDPFNNKEYKTAQVVISEDEAGKFGYQVVLVGSEYGLNGVDENDISKDELK